VSATVPLRDIMEDAIEAMHRLRVEQPTAFEEFVHFILAPAHTQNVILNFHGAKLQTVELRRVIR